MYRIYMIEDDQGILEAVKAKGEKWELQIHGVKLPQNPHGIFGNTAPPGHYGHRSPCLRRILLVHRASQAVQSPHSFPVLRLRQHEYGYGNEHGRRRLCGKAL